MYNRKSNFYKDGQKKMSIKLNEKYVSSFVGFFPSDKPQYLTLVIVDEPQGAYYGSVVAAPCAGEIFQRIISLKNIQPS